jgi:type IV pilus assembly protein PilM
MSTSFFSQLLATTPPSVAVEVTAKQVNVIGISAQGGTRAVIAHAVQPLPAGLVTPALNGVNVHESAALAAVVKAAADAISPRPRRVALILPDSVAKVSILRFEKIPAKEQELDQLIKWQMRKAAPFRIEDGQVSWAESAALPGGGREYLVVLARRESRSVEDRPAGRPAGKT